MSGSAKSGPQGRVKKALIWCALALCLLLAIAALIPLHGGYSSSPKAKIAEVLLALTEPREELAAYHLAHKRLPRDTAEAKIPLPPSRYVRQVTYDGATGELRAVIRNVSQNEGKTLILKAEISGGNLKWRCFSEDIAPKHLPEVCRKE